LKRNVEKRPTAALYINFFKKNFIKTVKTIDQKVPQALMNGLNGKVRQFGHGEEI
jgi:hypothetical protein